MSRNESAKIGSFFIWNLISGLARVRAGNSSLTV
jgi:hypothetical protein